MAKKIPVLWMLSGIIAWLGMSLYGIIRTIAVQGSLGNILDLAYLAIDWLASCILYFFFGALICYLIERYALHKHQNEKHPLWFYLTAAFWILSTIVVAIFGKSDMLSPILKLVFPLAFGIFFTGMFFASFFPDVIVKSYFGKLIFDMALLGGFMTWLYLEKKGIKYARWLLIGLFIIFFLGFAGCASRFM